MECAGLHVHDGRILVPLDLAVEVTAGKAEDLFDARLAKAGGGVNLEERELAEREHASVFEDVPAFHLALGHAEAAKAILPHNRVRAIEGSDAEVCCCRCRSRCRCRVSHTHMHALRRGIQVYVCARDHHLATCSPSHAHVARGPDHSMGARIRYERVMCPRSYVIGVSRNVYTRSRVSYRVIYDDHRNLRTWFVGRAPEAEAVGFRCTLPECRAWQILNRLCTECEDGEERCEEREHNDRSSHEYLLLMVLCKRV